AGKKRSFYTQNGAGSTVGRQTRLEIKYDNAQPGGTSSLGVRFTNIAIPQGAVIKHAHIEFVAAATSATDIIAPVFEIRGHKLTDAPTFANSGDKIDGRNKTTEMVEWSGTDLGAWVQNASYSTPDLTKVVQEMVDQSGWCGNNAMSFEVKAISGDTDARVAYSSDYVPPAADPNGSNGAYAPVLVVDIDEDAGNHGTGCINQVFTAQIAESEDDVEQTNSTGSMKLTDSSYDFNSAQTDAMRFRAVNIPKGANILSAELIVTTHKTNSSASTVTIKGEAADDSAQFTTAANNVTDRSTTSASTSWTLPNFDAIGRSVTSPDIAAVIQEIVDRSGWKAGNDLSLVFTTSGTTRSVKSWNNSPAESARLRIKIEYSGTVVPPLIKTVRERLGEIVDTYNASGYTPLVGQYFEAAQYYRGDDVVHGKRRSHRTEQKPVTRLSHPASYTGGTVDPAACQDPVNKGTSACYEETITGSPKYITPIEAACQSNYIVVLTDGEANHNGNDEDTDHLVSLAQTLAGGTCVTSSTGEKCGRDLAKFMATQDQTPTLPGDQIVKTYTNGFNLCDGELVQGTCCVSGAGTDSDGDGELDTCPTASVIAPSKAVKYLKDVAQNGLGSFFEAQTASQLASVFKAIFAEILTAPTSFATPSLSVNAFNKLFNRNQVYFSLFEPDTQVRWYGNVKKYNICDLIEFTGCTLGEILDASGTPAIGTDFRIKDSARSVWAAAADGINVRQGGAAAKVPASGERKVYTYTGSTAPVNVDLTQTEHAVADANTAITKTMLGDASMSDEERTEIIEWILGLDNADEDNDASTTERFKFEDPLHGSPVAVSYGGSESAPVDKLFVATNGGGLRMINPTSPTSADPDPAYAGREEWIFYPQAMLDIQKDLRANASGDHLFGLDLTPTVWSNDVDGNGKIEPSEGDFVRVIQAMRRGGNNIYAIDATPASEVTSPSDTTAIKPRLLWQIIGGAGGTTGFADLGQTWSQPKLATIRVVQSGVNVAKKVLIFGGGYDPSLDKVFNTSNQGAGVYVVDAATGALIASVGHSDGDSGTQLYSLEVPGMDFPIPADIATLDSDGDGAVDRLYFGDLGGNVWRVDLNDSLKFSGAVGSEVGVAGKLAKLAADPNAASTPPYAHANNTRKFHSAADVVQVYDTTYATSTKSRYDLVLIGSGAREDPLNGAAPNAANGIRDEFYALRDFTVGRLPDSNGDGLVDAFDASDPDKTFKTIVKSDLFDLTDDPFQGFVNGTEDLSSNATLAAALNSFKVADGWFMQLKQSNGDFVGEKVLSKPVVLAGRLFFTTYTPIASEADVESCKLNEGLGRLYGLNVLSGTALFASWDNAATTDKPTKGDRSLQLGGGIPSDAVPVFQKEGVTVIVGGGGGATTVDPGIALPRERTYWFEQGQ
ncbi:MAG: pilus assembly protein, partial [Reyranellaceae bacterium]